jgi:glutamate decarboxylase
VFAWSLKPDPARHWTLYDLSDRLRMQGWQVPAYPMPDDLADLTVQRVVVRNGLGMDLAARLVDELRTAIDYLNRLERPQPPTQTGGFHH